MSDCLTSHPSSTQCAVTSNTHELSLTSKRPLSNESCMPQRDTHKSSVSSPVKPYPPELKDTTNVSIMGLLSSKIGSPSKKPDQKSNMLLNPEKEVTNGEISFETPPRSVESVSNLPPEVKPNQPVQKARKSANKTIPSKPQTISLALGQLGASLGLQDKSLSDLDAKTIDKLFLNRAYAQSKAKKNNLHQPKINGASFKISPDRPVAEKKCEELPDLPNDDEEEESLILSLESESPSQAQPVESLATNRHHRMKRKRRKYKRGSVRTRRIKPKKRSTMQLIKIKSVTKDDNLDDSFIDVTSCDGVEDNTQPIQNECSKPETFRPPKYGVVSTKRQLLSNHSKRKKLGLSENHSSNQNTGDNVKCKHKSSLLDYFQREDTKSVGELKADKSPDNNNESINDNNKLMGKTKKTAKRKNNVLDETPPVNSGTIGADKVMLMSGMLDIETDKAMEADNSKDLSDKYQEVTDKGDNTPNQNTQEEDKLHQDRDNMHIDNVPSRDDVIDSDNLDSSQPPPAKRVKRMQSWDSNASDRTSASTIEMNPDLQHQRQAEPPSLAPYNTTSPPHHTHHPTSKPMDDTPTTAAITPSTSDNQTDDSNEYLSCNESTTEQDSNLQDTTDDGCGKVVCVNDQNGNESCYVKYVNTPNGVTYPEQCLSKTDLKRSQDKSLHVGSEAISLCGCKVEGTKTTSISGLYCQALDSIDSKVLGCYHKVSSNHLLRPSTRVPFMSLCDTHILRIKEHQCCPVCGHFCTQGRFLQCTSPQSKEDGQTIPTMHLYHAQCQIYLNNKYYCPHCGGISQQYERQLHSTQQQQPFVIHKAQRRQNGGARITMGISSPPSQPPANNDQHPTTLDPVSIGDKVEQFVTKSQLEGIVKIMNNNNKNKLLNRPKNLYMACKSQDMDKVLAVLEDCTNINHSYNEHRKQTALHTAAAGGNVAIVHVLLQSGAQVNVADSSLRSPLMEASEKGHVEVVKYLVSCGAIIQHKADDGMTALHLASRAGHLTVVQYLASLPAANINEKDEGGWTPLIWAAENVHTSTVQWLLTMGADPTIQDNELNTALHWAAYSGSVEIAEMFINHNCDIESTNENGDRPLHIASRQNHYECVILLLGRGSDCNAMNNDNDIPIDCCVEEGGSVDMALRVNKGLKELRPTKIERLVHRDIARGKENIAIPVLNKEDGESYPTDFVYVQANIETTQMNINRTITSLQHCSCIDSCSSFTCACTRNSIKCWYDQDGRLLENFNHIEPPLIFECNKACACWTTCSNRVVQLGITCRMEVFRTVGRGWGVRPLLNIPKGTFVCEYVGEHISDAEADSREDDSYLFDLDNKDSDTYCIDARRYGNVSRFINHLCEPNLTPVKVFIDHQDLRFPRICFFANRDIRVGEELGFDYGEKFWIIKYKMFTCACGSSKCKYSSTAIHKTILDFNRRQLEELKDQEKTT